MDDNRGDDDGDDDDDNDGDDGGNPKAARGSELVEKEWWWCCKTFQNCESQQSLVDLLTSTIFTLLSFVCLHGNISIYDTVSDVVESEVHQCQQNSDA